MSTRHKAVKATLDKGYASEWNDDHIADFTERVSWILTLCEQALTTQWDLFSAGTGNDPAAALTAGHSSVVFNTGGTTANTSGMSKELAGTPGNITSADDLPILSFALDIDTVHNAGNVVEVGFMDQGVAPFTANQDGAYFRVNNNILYAVTGEGAAETTTDLGAFNQYGHYRIEFYSYGGTTRVRFYVDDMVNAAATHSTNLPDSDITPVFAIQSQNNVDSTMRLDGVGLQVIRNQ